MKSPDLQAPDGRFMKTLSTDSLPVSGIRDADRILFPASSPKKEQPLLFRIQLFLFLFYAVLINAFPDPAR